MATKTKFKPSGVKLAKKPKEEKVAKPAPKKETIDFQQVPGSNALVPASQTATQTVGIYPPEPAAAFSPVELNSDNPKSLYWQVKSLVDKRFPQMLLKAEKAKTLAFMDESYDMAGTPIGGLSPPTWMDPCIFTSLVLADTEAAALIETAITKNSESVAKKLEARMEVLLTELYVEYVKLQFKNVKTVLARWIIASRIWDDPKFEKYKPAKD